MANLRLKLEKSTSNEYSLKWIKKPKLYSASVLVDNVYLEFERGLLLPDDVVLVKFDKQTAENTYEPLTKEITLMVIDSDTVELTDLTYTCVYGIIPKNVTSKVGTVKMSFSVKRPYSIGDVVKYKVITTQVVTVQIENGGSNEGYEGLDKNNYDSLAELINNKSLKPGPVGPPGPANKITMGTVTKGDEAQATLSGEAPSQVLNLVLPKGDKGNDGNKGEPGEKGEGGVSISKVTAGTPFASGDYTITPITVTLSNGQTQVVNVPVKNGAQGEQGNGTSVRVNGTIQGEVLFTRDPQTQIDEKQPKGNYATSEALNEKADKNTIPINSSFTLAGLGEKSYDSLTDKPTIPSRLSELTNDGNFVTGEEVNQAIATAKAYTDEKLSKYDFIEIVDALPQTGVPHKIYLEAKTNSQQEDLFDEFIWVNNKWEFMGAKQVGLGDYYTKKEIENKLSNERTQTNQSINLAVAPKQDAIVEELKEYNPNGKVTDCITFLYKAKQDSDDRITAVAQSKQEATDLQLNTANKNITGAINELKDMIRDLEDAFKAVDFTKINQLSQLFTVNASGGVNGRPLISFDAQIDAQIFNDKL